MFHCITGPREMYRFWVQELGEERQTHIFEGTEEAVGGHYSSLASRKILFIKHIADG